MKYHLRAESLVAILFLACTVTAQTKDRSPQAASKPPAQAAKTAEEIPPPAPGALFPAVVARVNGKPVLGRDLEQRIRAELVPIGNPAWKNLREDYRQELIASSLTSLVGTELLYQKAVETGIKVTDAEVKTEFDKFAQTFSSDAEINVMLANRGMDRSALYKELNRSLMVSKFIEQNVTKKIAVAPEEVSQYYSAHTEEFRHPDLIRTSHILIMVPEGATDVERGQARQRAEALLARIKKGEDFARLAKENSMDPSASQGGDIGLTQKGQLDPQYEAAAFALEVGQTSGVVETPFGFHIIKVTDKKKAGLSTLDEVKDDLSDFLKRRKTDEELQNLVTSLRNQAKIEILIPMGAAQASEKRP